ncbi:MAG: transglutaminase-like domain-containing protein, partial [Spirochaetota bacterium]
LVIGVLALTDVLMLADPATLARATRERTASPRAALNRRTVLRGMLLAIPLLLVALLLSVRWYSTGGVEAGGGILRPTLFRFDFAPFVQLESEITMSEDLVLLYRRPGRPRRELIRRYVLADYDPRRGFSVADDATSTPVADPADYLDRELVVQEYFLVNLDPGTRLAINEPVAFTQFENWDDSSFTAAFSARSMVSRAPPFRLARAGTDGLSAARVRELTDYGDNEPIRLLAEEITEGLDGAFARARAIEAYLHENYFYSLRPGIAADGDQLSHFLFESRKGYCSYYAFGMALMVRSLGIPARVAVGFFVDPGQEVLNFYPVLANMAHAWVEVYLGEYGWISFDPTSQTLAPGEEYEFGGGADPTELASLLEEILAQELRASQPTEIASRARYPPLSDRAERALPVVSRRSGALPRIRPRRAGRAVGGAALRTRTAPPFAPSRPTRPAVGAGVRGSSSSRRVAA